MRFVTTLALVRRTLALMNGLFSEAERVNQSNSLEMEADDDTWQHFSVIMVRLGDERLIIYQSDSLGDCVK